MKPPSSPPVTVVITCLNESHSIKALLQSLDRQTLLPTKVVVVDGGSTDNTETQVKKVKTKFDLVYKNYPGNRAVCRNYGIRLSRTQIVAVTDAGCLPDCDWLEKISWPFSQSRVSIVSGYYYPLIKSGFQDALAYFVLVSPNRAGITEFFPATRSVAFLKSAWQQVGGFSEHLWHNEDYDFAHKLKSAGFSFYFAPQAKVAWEPRSNLTQSAVMFFRFALGDIEAGIVRPQVIRLFARYLVAIFAFFVIWEIDYRLALLWLVSLAVLYSLAAVVKMVSNLRRFASFVWVPVIQFTADFSVMFGSIVGWLLKIYAK